ncbi:cytochrome P450 family protein [Streptomyces sp. NPDC055036]
MDQQRYPLDAFGRDIAGEAAHLRTLGDIVPVELTGGIPAYAITRYDTLRALMLNPQVSKDPRQHWARWNDAQTRPEWKWILGWVGPENMLNTYGANHTRLRKPLISAFTARRVESLRTPIQTITEQLLTPLDGGPPGQTVDLRTVLALPLPKGVMGNLLGVPPHQRTDIDDLVEGIMDTTASDEQAARTIAQIDTVIPALIDYKRANPGDDLVTDLLHHGQLRPDELRDTILLLYGAGYETTVHLITNTLYELLTHPDHLQRLLAGDITWDQVLGETLRRHPSIANLPLRYAITDIRVGDVTIEAGSAILTTLAAAGLDPDHYGPTAAQFDPDRDSSDHLSFGIGVHHCIGRPLALMEAEYALHSLFEHFPDIRLGTPPDHVPHVPSFIANGPDTLTVTLTQPPIPQLTPRRRISRADRQSLTAYCVWANDHGSSRGHSIRRIADDTRRSYGTIQQILATQRSSRGRR